MKNKKQPELTENQTVWKSDNQGVKEDTFIQTGRRGGDEQLGREDSWQRGGCRTGVGKTAAGGPSEAADCGIGWARLQLAGKEQLADPWLVAGGPGGPTFKCR